MNASAMPLVPRFVAAIGLGGNLGDVADSMRSALRGLSELPGTSVRQVSSLYRTRPVDADGPDYLNAVALIETPLGPQELLGALMQQEQACHRERPYHHAPRTLDLDLLAHGDARRDTAILQLPHPRWHERAFVLEPLIEALESAGLDAATDLGLNTMPDEARRAQLQRSQGIERLGPIPR